MDARTRDLVRQRAGQQCEYCRLPDQPAEFSFHVEHIVAVVHEPNHHESNLAWACPHCNLHKGPNLMTIDRSTGEKIELFNPRTDVWDEHFEMNGFAVVGISSMGRGTARLLNMNEASRVSLRREIMS